MNLSLIIPCYNYEKLISSNLEKLILKLKKFNHKFEIILVNDGSTDKTLDKLKIIKNKLINKYENSTSWQRNVAHFLKTRNPHKRTALKEVMHQIEFYDKLRKENFQKLNNELYNELRKYSNGIIT